MKSWVRKRSLKVCEFCNEDFASWVQRYCNLCFVKIYLKMRRISSEFTLRKLGINLQGMCENLS